MINGVKKHFIAVGNGLTAKPQRSLGGLIGNGQSVQCVNSGTIVLLCKCVGQIEKPSIIVPF